jgi:hypothetical protein
MLDHDAVAKDPAISALLEAVHARFRSNVAAVLVYGSYLRGARDTLIDLYVLLDRYRPTIPRWEAFLGAALAPNVYHLKTSIQDTSQLQEIPALPLAPVRAKCSVMRVDQLERAVKNTFVPYFWARFSQPCVVVYTANDDMRRRVGEMCKTAIRTFLSEIPPRSTAHATFVKGFELTYKCEVRPERKGVAKILYQSNAGYFEAAFAAVEKDTSHALNKTTCESSSWRLRRTVSKCIGVLRAIKAGATFDDPLEYVAWKASRHSGINIEPTLRQRRYPLLFGWLFLWRLYRLGAFR